MTDTPRSRGAKAIEALIGAAGLAVVNLVGLPIAMWVTEEPGEIPTEWVVAGTFGCIQLLWVVPIAAALAALKRGWAILGVTLTAAVTFLLASAWMMFVVAITP